jgi:hypothetical protein
MYFSKFYHVSVLLVKGNKGCARLSRNGALITSGVWVPIEEQAAVTGLSTCQRITRHSCAALTPDFCSARTCGTCTTTQVWYGAGVSALYGLPLVLATRPAQGQAA